MPLNYGSISKPSISDNSEGQKLLENVDDATEPEFIEGSAVRDFFVQVLILIFLIMIACCNGTIIGYSAILLPKLKSTNETLKIDDEMGSWLASINTAVIPIGAFISGVLIDVVGRKGTLQIYCCTITTGWITICLSQSHIALLVGRFICGIASGMGMVPGQVYVAEISDPKIRGVYTSLPFTGISAGVLLVYGFGSVFTWRFTAGLCILVPAIALIILFILPESHVWYARRGRNDVAKKSLYWFRGRKIDAAKEEFQQLISRIDNEKRVIQENPQPVWKTIFNRQLIKPFFITNALIILQTLSGVYIFMFYAVEIFMAIGKINVNDFIAAVLTAAVRLVFAFIASMVMSTVGRRPIGLVSCIGTSIFACLFGVLLYYKDFVNGYILALCLLAYIASNTIGLMILPGMMVGELFPAKTRGLAGGTTFTSYSVFTFVITKTFPYFKNLVDIYGIFWFFSFSSFLATLLIYLMLPETQNKTLNEIEDYFNQDNILWITRDRNPRTRLS